MFLLDTFLGFDAADLASDCQRMHKGFLDMSFECIREFIGEESAVYVPGRFPDSLGEVALLARLAPRQCRLRRVRSDEAWTGNL
jgi:hypothetical protein